MSLVRRVTTRLSGRPILIGSWLLVAFVWFVLQAGPVLLQRGYLGNLPETLSSVRNFGQWDQMSYLAISSNVQHGLPALTEPFTATGSLYYSPAYYLLLGGVARISGISVITVSNLVGMTMSLAFVVLVGWFGYSQIRRDWAPLLGLAPLLIGTLSTVRYGDWFVQYFSHTFLWPPYASLYFINAELAALVVGGVGFGLVLHTMFRNPSGFLSERAVGIGFLLVGLTASMHVYVFITLTISVSLVAGAGWLASTRSAVNWRLAGIGLASIYPIGLTLRSAAGPAFAAGALLVPLGAVVIPAIRRLGPRALLPWTALLIGASPHLVRIAYGVVTGDAFIATRQTTSEGLTVPIAQGILLHLPILMLLVWLVSLRPNGQSTVRMGRILGGALGVAWVLLSFNHLWGFAQEPYRFMILSNIVIVATAPTLIVLGLRSTKGLGPSRIHRALAAGTLAVLVLSVADLPLWWSQMRQFGVVERSSAAVVQQIDALLDDGLVLLDPCLNPYIFKLDTGRRIVMYNAGIAHPEPLFEIDRLLALSRDGTLDLEAARAGAVSRIVSREDCSWHSQLPERGALMIGAVESEQGKYSIWSLRYDG